MTIHERNSELANAKSTYEILAPEYYSDFHKTSRNFDAATHEALSSPVTLDSSGLILELGAGRGRAQEYLDVDTERVIQSDISNAMLNVTPREPCLLRIISDARRTPFVDESFSSVLAFLFDPFNEQAFFDEVFRILKPGGTLVGTLPAYIWGVSLREKLGIPVDRTRFIARTGELLMAPSKLSSNEELQYRLGKAGFARGKVSSHCLPDDVQVVSPDILRAAKSRGVAIHELPILQLIIGRKPKWISQE